ncbi:unnamed protein product [Ascophyllum nodosum]
MMPTFSSSHEAVAWMESVCQAFPTNPKEAEAALMELRRSEHAIEVSKTILGQSQVPMAQFHALLALQEVVLARWESVPHADRRSLKAFLWDFISREWSRRLERSVASQALRTFCVFWRRGWAGETEETKLSLFALLRQGVNEGGFAALRSAKALYALVSEFSSTRATALGLPLEFFKITHAAFDKIGLDQSLALSMELLGEAVKAVADPEALADASVVELVTTAVNVCAEVLSWEFKYVEAWQIPSAQQLITPGPRWRQYLIRPDFLGVVFQVYHRVRVRGNSSSSGGSLPHSLRQLLLQLSSVHGHIFEDEDQRRAYASFLVEGTAAVLSSPLVAGKGTHGGGRSVAEAAADEEAQADEYIGIASMAMRLVSNFKLASLAPLECFGGFAQQLASLSSRMLHESAALAGQDDYLEDGKAWRDETFALLLEAWVAMADDPLVRSGKDPALRKGMEDTTFPLYEQYVAHELAVSRAEAEASVGQEEDDEEEEIGAADKDEQMCAAACLGRLSPARALATVDLQMRGVSETLACLFETGSVNGRAALLPGGLGLSPEATGVMEQSRTIVVLATHLVADKDDGDAMVPEVLHDAFLADERAADLLVQLVRSLLKVLEMHATLLGRGIGGQGGQGRAPVSVSPLLSPYLGGALLWSLTRWASAYLLPDLTLYEGRQFSYRLTLAFGTSAPGVTLYAPPKTRGVAADAGAGVGALQPAGGGGVSVREGMEVVEALLRASWACLCAWPSQPDVCVNALDLMGVLASRTKASATTTLSLWWEIVAACGGRDTGEAGAGATRPQQGFRRLAADLQGMLVQRLCEGVLHRAHDTTSAKDGFDKVAGPVWTRLRGLLHAVGGLDGVQRQSPRVVAECLLCVRLCRGVVVGCGTAGVSYHDLGEAFVEQTYDGMTLLLAMHVSSAQDVVHEVLQFLRDVADLLLIYMSASRAMALYEACGKALKIYADQQAGCIRRVDPTSEEDSYDDVLCVLELLSHLVTKDLVDESDEPPGEKGREVVVTDVVFFGLKKVMPLMTEGLLQFPSLASQYFYLVGFLVQTYAHKLAALEFELFHQIVNSLVFGCQQAEASLARNSLQAITVMVTHHVAEVMKGKEGLSGHLAVKPDTFLEILRTLLHMVVFQQLVWDRLEACAQAVLPLLVCEKEGFQRLAAEIVAAQPETTRPRLVEAFETLYACHGKCGGGLERLGRRRFEAGMREFVTSIRAFLQTK